MKSATKRRLTGDEIDAVVAKTFGCRPERVEEFHGGSMNAAYRIDPPGRDPAVLKVGSSRAAPLLTYEVDALRTEAHFYEAVGDLFPLPTFIAKDFTREVIDSDYIVIEMLNGKPWTEVADQVSESDGTRLKRELGRHVGRLHTLRGTRFGYLQPGTPSGVTWHEAFFAMLDAVLEDTITWNVALPISPDAIRSGVEVASWALHDVKTPCLLHFDLWKSNVFLTTGQDGAWSLEGVIDCERSYYGDPLAELVGVNPMQDPHDLAFIEGYAETALTPYELTPSAETRLTMYSVYLALIWVAEAVPHGYLEGAEREVQPLREFYDGLGKQIATLVETCRQST